MYLELPRLQHRRHYHFIIYYYYGYDYKILCHVDEDAIILLLYYSCAWMRNFFFLKIHIAMIIMYIHTNTYSVDVDGMIICRIICNFLYFVFFFIPFFFIELILLFLQDFSSVAYSQYEYYDNDILL